MKGLEYRLLGSFEVWRDGGRLALDAAKQRGLLALLLLHANQVVSAERLIDELWQGKPPPTAGTALQGYVSQLRKLLEPERPKGEPAQVLATEAAGYVLRAEPGAIDALRFERLLHEGRAALARDRPEAAAQLLREGLALFGGAPLADFAYEPWAAEETARLEELRLVALEERIDAELALGLHEELAVELHGLAAEHPLRERVRAQLILALYRCGRQADALDEYRSARRALTEELGIEPGPELQELQRAVLKQDASLAPPQRSTAKRPRLPLPPSSFVGRKREVEEVVSLLKRPEVRLLSLVGTGGTGKTRLALEAGRAAEAGFADGAIFVALAAVTDGELVLPTIAKALRVEEAGGSLLERVGETLRDAQVLLVLDNFEQVTDAAPLLTELLSRAPELKLLVTSRTALRLSGEREYAVPPLSLPPAAGLGLEEAQESEAVALFVERAQATDPQFELTAANAQPVAEICIRLDGLPLGLELAAARAKLLPPEAILARLDDRFRLLAGGARDLPDRQRTLRAAIDWSYDLLMEEEQRVFRMLGVFAGTFDLDAVAAVVGDEDDELDTLASLLDKSLLRRRDGPDGELRLSLLVTIREYALDRLREVGEEDAARARHADYAVALAIAAEPELVGARQGEALARLELALDDLRAALARLLEREPERALRLANALYLFWYLHGHLREGRRWLEAALDRSDPTPEDRAKALRVLGALAEHAGELTRARELGEQSLALYRDLGDGRSAAACLNNLGTVAVIQGDHERARRHFEESIELKRGLGDQRGIGLTLSNLAIVATKDGDFEAGKRLHEEALAILRELGMLTPLANSLSSLAELELLGGAAARARELVDEVLEIRRSLGDRGGLADTLITLTRVALAEGDAPAAGEAAAESLAISRETGDREGIAAAVEALGDAAAARGETVEAVRLRAAAAAHRRRIEAPLAPIDRTFAELTLEPARARLSEDAFEAAWTEGEELSVDEVQPTTGGPVASR